MEIDNISKVTTQTQLTDVHEYIGSKHDATTHVSRELWYDNDTPAPNFDQNELGMWWGGEGNSGVTGSGDYTFNVLSMSDDGSYHGMEQTDWAQQAESGKLKLAVSATKDTQSQCVYARCKAKWRNHCAENSPAAALFSTDNGHAGLNGAYAETVQVTGTEGDVTNIRPLATVVGENNPGKYNRL